MLVDFLVDHCGSDDGANAVTTAAVTASARKMGRKAIMVCTDWNYLCVWNDVVEKVVVEDIPPKANLNLATYCT